MNRPAKYVIIAVITAVIAAAAYVFRAALLASFLFVNIAVQDGWWRPLEVFTNEPLIEKGVTVRAVGELLKADMYLPSGTDRHAAILIYVPFAGGGEDNPALVNLAESLAESGFVVMVPVRTETEAVLRQGDRKDIISAFSYLIRHERVESDKAGMFGISYGSGPVFLAAADDRIRDDVDFIISYAGYYELKEAMRYVVTGEYSRDGINEHLEPEPWVKDTAKSNLVSFGLTEERVEGFFNAPERFDKLLSEEQELLRAMHTLSPASVISRIDAKTLIIHSRGDYTIPYTESLRLNEALRGRIPTTLAIVDMLVHSETRPMTWKTLRENYIPSFRTGHSFLMKVLDLR